ncbi:hypothetical protein PT974_11768 [Cladobotryum mycophilum]|uniref:Uncharacterized protein n=1 Tax=Cladobotryum mycophilum TaxID=491253 RepID=A0ABR0S7J3_9HYPO
MDARFRNIYHIGSLYRRLRYSATAPRSRPSGLYRNNVRLNAVPLGNMSLQDISDISLSIELSTPKPPTNAPFFSDPGRYAQNHVAFCGNVATRMSFSSIVVRLSNLDITSILITNSAFLVPSDIPPDIHPHTLHSRHRQFHDPSDMERYVTFNECHRVRYTTDEGICIHDDFIPVRYEFTTVAASVQFQCDVRQKQLIGFYDVDVVWTDKQSRTDSFGKVKGIGAIQRLKLWRDNYTTFHSLSILANKTDQQYREYEVQVFDGELKRDERQRQTRLNVNTRRGSAPDEHSQPRVSLAQRIRPRVRSTGQANRTRPDLGSSPRTANIDIRHLHFQFTYKEGYQQFLADWIRAHSSDRSYHNIPFPSNHSDSSQPGTLIDANPATASSTEGQG